MRAGDRVRITKPNHPAKNCAGVVLGFGDTDGASTVYIASEANYAGKVWPIFAMRLHQVELIAEGPIATSRRLVEDIIDAAEARGCPLRGIYSWAGPYKPKKETTG